MVSSISSLIGQALFYLLNLMVMRISGAQHAKKGREQSLRHFTDSQVENGAQCTRNVTLSFHFA